MRRFVPSSPSFFRPVKRSLLAGLAALFVFAAWIPAPLEVAADPASPPNPAKSAWFLLGIQELVSWGTPAIYIVVALASLLVVLPWLPLPPLERVGWFEPTQRWVTVWVLLISLGFIALTVVGLFLRGPDWRLALPF